eukprot:g829.t1
MVICARLRPPQHLKKKKTISSITYDITEEFNGKNKLNLSLPDHTARDPISSNAKYIDHSAKRLTFAFDKVFDTHTKQGEIFNTLAIPIIEDALHGTKNGTIIAYGQTSSGKTYTLTGGENFADRGVIPRAISYILNKTQKKVEISFCEVYNNEIYDLIEEEKDRSRKKMRVKCEKGILSRYQVEDETKALRLLFAGSVNRKHCDTPMNSLSSRSHCIFTIHIEHQKSTRIGGGSAANLPQSFETRIHLVDLAGSERVYKDIQAGMQRRNSLVKLEGTHINLSLHHLERLIVSLQTSDRAQYRSCKLTSILKGSFDGHANLTFLVHLSTNLFNLRETISSCRFGEKCKSMQLQVLRRFHQNVETSREPTKKNDGEEETNEEESKINKTRALQKIVHKAQSLQLRRECNRLKQALDILTDVFQKQVLQETVSLHDNPSMRITIPRGYASGMVDKFFDDVLLKKRHHTSASAQLVVTVTVESVRSARRYFEAVKGKLLKIEDTLQKLDVSLRNAQHAEKKGERGQASYSRKRLQPLKFSNKKRFTNGIPTKRRGEKQGISDSTGAQVAATVLKKETLFNSTANLEKFSKRLHARMNEASKIHLGKSFTSHHGNRQRRFKGSTQKNSGNSSNSERLLQRKLLAKGDMFFDQGGHRPVYLWFTPDFRDIRWKLIPNRAKRNLPDASTDGKFFAAPVDALRTIDPLVKVIDCDVENEELPTDDDAEPAPEEKVDNIDTDNSTNTQAPKRSVTKHDTNHNSATFSCFPSCFPFCGHKMEQSSIQFTFDKKKIREAQKKFPTRKYRAIKHLKVYIIPRPSSSLTLEYRDQWIKALHQQLMPVSKKDYI